MFERDKAELRDLGIPLETGRNSAFDAEDGYRIRRGDYELPPIEFDAAEAAAVGLAARLWQSATLGEPARQALIKLRAAGTEVRAADAPGAVPQLDASDPSLPALLDAARTATVVAFDYVKAGREPRPSAARSSRGACCPGAGAGTSPASTATAASRAASGSRASAGAVETVGGPGAFERPEKVDLLDMVAGRGPDDGRLGAGAGGRARRRRRCAASPPSDDRRRADHHLHRHELAGPRRSPAPAPAPRCSNRRSSSTAVVEPAARRRPGGR